MIFCRNFFCLTVPKKIIGETFCVPEIFFGSKIFVGKMVGGIITVFRQILFVALCRKMFVGESSSNSLVSGIDKLYAYEGYVMIFCRNLFVSH